MSPSVIPPQFSTSGARLNSRRLRRALSLSILASSSGMFWLFAAFGMPISMLMESLGGKALLVGMVVTIQQVATITQIPVALLAERLKTRKFFWAITALIHRMVWIVPVLAITWLNPQSSAARWTILGALMVSAVFANANIPLWFSWLGDLVPDRMKSRFWGRRQGFTMIVYLLATFGAGWILDRFPDPQHPGGSYMGFVIVFTIAWISGLLDIVIHLFVPEPQAAPVERDGTTLQRILAPLRDRPFRCLTLAYGVWFFSVGLVGSFGMLYLKRQFGVTYTQLSATLISASVATAASGFLWARMMELVGVRAFGAAMMLVAPLMGAAWFMMTDRVVGITLPFVGLLTMPQPVAILLVMNLFSGAFYSGVGLCQLTLSGSLAPRANPTMAMATHWTIVGLMGAAGPLVGGLVTDWVTLHPLPFTLPTGLPFGFMHVLVIIQVLVVWFVALPMLLRVPGGGRELPVKFLVGNPLRAASVIYNLSSIVGVATSRARADAVRRLGRGAEVVVEDLMHRLEDPAVDVREEAALALGRVGTDDAVDALVRKLEDPESDLSPHIARALRGRPHPRSVEALVRKLVDPDRETRTESARTLGVIGDRRAAPSLLEMLSSSSDSKVVSASSDALARLGELAAVYEIVPRMQATRNPVLYRSLAVAVADLLGPHDSFYPLMVAEEQERGALVPKWLGRLKRRIKRATRDSFPEQGVSLCAQLDAIEADYENGGETSLSASLFRLGLGLATLSHGVAHGSDTRAAIDSLIWRDQRFGISIWCLFMLSDPDGEGAQAEHSPNQWVETLLGIYILAQWSSPKEVATGRPERMKGRKPRGPRGKPETARDAQ